MKKIIILSIFMLIFASGFYILFLNQQEPGTISIGILHSLSGPMKELEINGVDAVQLAIDEVNSMGGVLGKKIKPIIFDGASDWPTFARGAEQLITQEHVTAIFGCWTSASRKAVVPIVEKHKSLLFYPVQYEGLEESSYVIYTGSTANQQVIPGVVWAFHNLGKKFFLIGSDYVYPRAANEISKEVINSLGGTVVGEEYIVLESKNIEHIVKKIIETKPDVILNNLVGSSNVPFFQQLRQAGITPEKTPTLSFVFNELELQSLDLSSMIGDYSAFSYFQSIKNIKNRGFVKKFKEKFGQHRLLADFMEAAYYGVHLWAQAVNEVGSTNVDKVRMQLKNQSYNAPEGIISIDQNNQHTWKFARIGKILSNGQFNIVWTSPKSIPPIPYLTDYRSKESWDNFLHKLYVEWGERWSAE